MHSLLTLCSLLHFALFVIACRDTNLRRRCRKYFSQSHGDKTTDSTTRLANTRTPSLTSASKLTGMYTSDDRKGELPPCDELESGQIMHSVEPTTQWTYPGKLENKNTVWQPEIEDRNLICPPLVTDLGGLSEDNSPVVGHPAMGSVDKEYEARMQMERDAANHPALRHLNAREKEMRG